MAASDLGIRTTSGLGATSPSSDLNCRGGEGEVWLYANSVQLAKAFGAFAWRRLVMMACSHLELGMRTSAPLDALKQAASSEKRIIRLDSKHPAGFRSPKLAGLDSLGRLSGACGPRLPLALW